MNREQNLPQPCHGHRCKREGTVVVGLGRPGPLQRAAGQVQTRLNVCEYHATVYEGYGWRRVDA